MLVSAAWLMVAMVAAGPVAAQEGSAGPATAEPCPAGAVSEQYGTEEVCGTPSEGADAARDAASDSWRAAGAKGGAEAFGEALEAAGVGNAPPAAPPISEKKEGLGLSVLPVTGGIPVSSLLAGVLLTAGGLLGFKTVSRRRPRRPCKQRGMA